MYTEHNNNNIYVQKLCPTCSKVTQLSASYTGINGGPYIITDGSPHPVLADLHTTSIWCCSTNQPDVTSTASCRRDLAGELIIFIPGLFLRVRFSKPSDGSRFPSMLQSYVLSSNLTSGIYLSIVFLLYFFKLFTKCEVVAVCISHLRGMHLTPASSP